MRFTGQDYPAFYGWRVPAPAPSDYSSLWRWQAGRCAMCDAEGKLVLDHCHELGVMRGWICEPCNAREPRSDSYIVTAWRAGANPFRVFDVREVYYSPFSGQLVLSIAAQKVLSPGADEPLTLEQRLGVLDSLSSGVVSDDPLVAEGVRLTLRSRRSVLKGMAAL